VDFLKEQVNELEHVIASSVDIDGEGDHEKIMKRIKKLKMEKDISVSRISEIKDETRCGSSIQDELLLDANYKLININERLKKYSEDIPKAKIREFDASVVRAAHNAEISFLKRRLEVAKGELSECL